jgi:hypothetical protein
MIANWKVTAWLSSPLAGNPPQFDAILGWELARRLGYKHARKLTRDIRLSGVEIPPIPLAKRTINGVDIFCCSSPIMPEPSAEWVDRISKRINTDEIALLLAPEYRKSLLVASGPYKMRYVPERIRLIDCICWFVRGDRKEINKLTKSVLAIGKHRNIGYGQIERWTFDEMENDCSISAMRHGKLVLMRIVPFGPALQIMTAYKRSFGAPRMPYWHPENYMEIAIPI